MASTSCGQPAWSSMTTVPTTRTEGIRGVAASTAPVTLKLPAIAGMADAMRPVIALKAVMTTAGTAVLTIPVVGTVLKVWTSPEGRNMSTPWSNPRAAIVAALTG
ncbi:hypothetical protein D3C75_1002910 [compost metagenome]